MVRLRYNKGFKVEYFTLEGTLFSLPSHEEAYQGAKGSNIR